jgi:hypothetical protein
MLARDALTILAQAPDNEQAIISIRGAITVPPVSLSDKQNYWRLFLLGDVALKDIDPGPLDRHIALYFPAAYGLHTGAGPIDGLDAYLKLRTMYEQYYCKNDFTPSVPSRTGPAPTDAAAAVSAKAKSVSAWKAPLPPGPAPSSHPDFPPLPLTVRQQVVAPPTSAELTRYEHKADIDEYINRILEQKLDGFRQDTVRALEEINSKTETTFKAVDNRIANQERALAVAALQSRVDPLHRAYDSLLALQRNLQGLEKDLKRTARTSYPDQAEDLVDLTAQIKAEKDNIAKKTTKLQQRYTSLLLEAQALQVTLQDLPDMDFPDGPA